MGLFLFIVLLVGGAGFWYWRNIYNSPKRILAKTIGNLSQIRSLGYQGDLKFSTASFLGSSFSLGFEGEADWANPNEPKSKTQVVIKNDAVQLARVEALAINEETYLKFGDLTSFLGTLLGQANGLSNLQDKWILLDLTKIFGESLTNQEKKDVSPEKLEEWFGFIKANPFFKITENLGEAELGSVKTHHFKYEIDKENLEKALSKWQEMVYGEEYSAIDKELFGRSLENTEFKGGEIWIGKANLLPYKITLGLIEEVNDQASGIELSLSLRSFNEAVTVEKPTEFLTTQEALQQLDSLLLPR